MNFEVGFYILCGVCGALAGALVYFIWSKNASDMQRDATEKLCRRYLEKIEKLEHAIVALRRK